jgi:hypothetical protein
MERHGAGVLLAGRTDCDAALLKRAALGVASKWTNRDASALLLDAAQGVSLTRVGGRPEGRPPT